MESQWWAHISSTMHTRGHRNKLYKYQLHHAIMANITVCVYCTFVHGMQHSQTIHTCTVQRLPACHIWFTFSGWIISWHAAQGILCLMRASSHKQFARVISNMRLLSKCHWILNLTTNLITWGPITYVQAKRGDASFILKYWHEENRKPGSHSHSNPDWFKDI